MTRKIDPLWVPVKTDSPLANQIRNILCAIQNLKRQCGDKFLAIVEDCESWEAYLMAELKMGGK